MIQRQITHAPGTFLICASCGREPHHYAAHGSTSHENAMFSALAERHQLECPCERRTGWCATLIDAIRTWNERSETSSSELYVERAAAESCLDRNGNQEGGA